jgi:hypothetical protein
MILQLLRSAPLLPRRLERRGYILDRRGQLLYIRRTNCGHSKHMPVLQQQRMLTNGRGSKFAKSGSLMRLVELC